MHLLAPCDSLGALQGDLNVHSLNASEAERARGLIESAPFIGQLGIRFRDCGEGWCETSLEGTPELTQQDGFLHAGVLATMADHTASAAAATRMSEGQRVLSIEFKINLLRPASGRQVRCRADVLRHGRTISVVESDVFCLIDQGEKRVARATVTLAIGSETAPAS